MGVRQRLLEQIREKLDEGRDKTAERVADLCVNISEKANEEDIRDMTKSMLEAVEFLPSLAIFSLNLVVDSRVPIGEKIKIGLLTAYLISPADIVLMELIGPMALMDDIVIVGYLIYSIAGMIGNLDEEVVNDNWVGKPEHVQQFVDAARAIAGMGGAGRLAGLDRELEQNI